MLCRKLLFTFGLLLIACSAFSQTGTIRGTIKDATTSEPVIGANVSIEGTTIGSSTDLEGNFLIQRVKPGTYNIIISYISYKTKRIENLTVEADKVVQINTFIEEESTTLSDVVITAERAKNTEISVINTIKTAQLIVSGISAEQISKSQDRDAAQVVKRIPGVTVINDRFIMVRGLAERYSPAMLHNVFAPSMETDVRSFAFDIVPSSQLDRIFIYKSPSPELPGDFAGGTVKIFTKDIPDENSIIVDYSTQFRTGTTFGDFYHQQKGPGHWTGFNRGFYNLPAGFPDNLRRLSGDALVQAGRSLNNSLWTEEKGVAIPDQRIGLTINRRFETKKGIEIGHVTALTYSNTWTTFDIDRSDFNEFDQVKGASNPIYNYQDDQYTQNIRLGVLHNWAFRFNDRHKMEFKNLFNQISTSQYVYRTGINFESAYSPVNHSFDQVYRGVYSGQLKGQHNFSDDRLKVEWVAGFNRAYRDQPDYKRYRSDLDVIEGGTTLYVPPGAAAAEFLGRFFSEMKETAYTGAVDVRRKFSIAGSYEFEVSAGAFYERKDRNFLARNIGYNRANSLFFDLNLLNGTIANLFRDENINSITGIRIDEQSNPNDSYTASNDLFATYLMTNLPITEKLKLIGGVRIERNLQTLNSATLTNDPINVNNLIVRPLPSFNFMYSLNDKTQIRAAYGITLNRPEFRELAPFGFYDFNFNFTNKGNENLLTPQIHNVDLRWEKYPKSGEIISIAAFYKYFDKPIETLFVPGAGSGGAKTFTYDNAKSSYSYGLEIDIKKTLAGLTSSSILNDVAVLFNASLIRSLVDLGDRAVGQSDRRPLQGQSPYIINTGIFYNNVEKDLQVNLLYNIIGPRIFIVGYEGYPDIYEMPRSQIDISVTKRLGRYLQVKVGIADLLNQEVLLLQDGNANGKFERTIDQKIQRFRPGTVFSTGISVRL
ncbi:TonB-dependent receptor domain-containing protein [Rhodoflexus sp.]